MPICTVWILKYVQQYYVKWFWTVSSLGAPDITPCLKSPVENSEEISGKNNTSLTICKRQASHEVLATGKPPYLETGCQALFREPNRFTLPSLRSLSAGNGRTSLQDNLTSRTHTFPTLTSSMAVTMQAALLPIGATLQHGNCLEIIRIKTEEKATVSRQGTILPPITRRQKKRAWS